MPRLSTADDASRKEDDVKSLQDAFATPARLNDFITLYRLNILQPLIPGLRKEGYSELPASTSSGQSSSSSASNSGRIGREGGPYYPDTGGPLGVVPTGPSGGEGRGDGRRPPDYGGDHDPLRVPGSGGRGSNHPNPYDIGRSDLLPLGGMGGTFAGPLGGGIGGAGMGGGNGMFMGRDHPLFRDRFVNDGGVGGGEPQGGAGRLWGGDGFLPPGAVPPGARFDPVGPGVSLSRLSCDDQFAGWLSHSLIWVRQNGPPGGLGTGGPGFGGGQGIGSFPGGSGGHRGGNGQRRGHPDIEVSLETPSSHRLGPAMLTVSFLVLAQRMPGSSGNDYDAMFG